MLIKVARSSRPAERFFCLRMLFKWRPKLFLDSARLPLRTSFVKNLKSIGGLLLSDNVVSHNEETH
jgi:hypothetical protein